LVLFLPSLWGYALGFGNDKAAFTAGVSWVAGRFLYMMGFPEKRGAGFAISTLTQTLLAVASLGKAGKIAYDKYKN
jgi:hypothetical protein